MRRYLLLAPLALAGCGGSSTHVVRGDPLVAASTATRKQASEQVAMQAKIELSGQSLSLSGNGAFAQKHGQLNLRFDVGSLGSSSLDEIFDGNVVWLRSPLLSGSLHGKHWIKLDLTKEVHAFGLTLNALAGQTPAVALDKLRLRGKVSTLGTETVDGIETTHYRKALNVKDSGGLYKSADAWIDRKGLVRRVKLDYGARVDPTSNDRAHTVLTMTFSNFGAPVAVNPPPASDVVESSQVGK